MKPLIVFFWLVLFLASCEEIIIERPVIDTVYVDRYTEPQFITVRDTIETVVTDTVKVNVVIRDTVVNHTHTTDTLIQVVTKDSIVYKIVEKTVIVHDTVKVVQVVHDTIINNVVIHDTIEVEKIVKVYETVYVEVIKIEQRVIYHDTLYIATDIRPVNSIPPELMPFVQEFFTLAGSRAVGGPMIIQYYKPEDMPGEGWVSHSYKLGWQYSQMVIQVSEGIPHEYLYTAILA